jgi:hypothetical protein
MFDLQRQSSIFGAADPGCELSSYAMLSAVIWHELCLASRRYPGVVRSFDIEFGERLPAASPNGGCVCGGSPDRNLDSGKDSDPSPD